MRKKLLFLLLAMVLIMGQSWAGTQDTPNARQARRIFNQAFNQVFHSDGCAFNYDVNLVGIYKCQGRLWVAGKHSHYEEKRLMAWDDDVTTYRVDKKKKTVEIHNSHSPKKDKYTSKFKFKVSDYDYHIADGGSTYQLSLKLNKNGHSTIKQIIGVR